MPPEATRFRVLVVDDDPDYARLVSVIVERSGFGTPLLASTGAEGLKLAADADLVLLDHQLPDTDGLNLLPALKAMPGQPAVILVTAHGDEALAAGALRAGADDYLVKDPTLPSLLPEVIERARRHRALQEALGAAERDLVHAERMAAIGQLNVTISHNINNPLMVAFAEAEMLLLDTKLSSEQRTSIQSIKKALQRIREIVEQVNALRHDKTTAYPGGLEMIDLSRRSRPTPVNAGDALLWLTDESIARVVASLLKHAGFAVERFTDPGTLGHRANDRGVTLVVVLGGEAPGADPLGGFMPGVNRRYTLVTLVYRDGAAARAAGADHVVQLPFDPGTFTNDLLAVMRG